MARASLLELLHPAGQAGSVRVMGGNCQPGTLMCPERAESPAGPADLIILAPTEEECTNPGWIECAAAEAAKVLAPEGLVYLVAKPRCRFALARAFRRRGLRVEARYQHHPDWTECRTLIPLERRAVAYAYTSLIRTDARRRRIALAVLSLPGALRLLAWLLPAAGLAMRRRGSRPLFGWLSALLPASPRTSSAVVNASWRGSGGAVTVHAFRNRETLPSHIAKTSLLNDAGAAEQGREAANLLHVASAAGRTGVEVPRLLAEGRLWERPVLVESALRGSSAAAWLGHYPERLPVLLSALAGWLEAWHRATAVRGPLTRDLLEAAVLHPAAAVCAGLSARQGYIDGLEMVCRAAEGRNVPLVPAHNDLTMVNVLVRNGDGAGAPLRVGVVDWEDASVGNLPLTDFFYAAVDAAAATLGYADRRAAFDACFMEGGAWTGLVASHGARLCRTLDISEDLATLSFHACWLRSATRAHERPEGKEAQHFLDIARSLAQRTATGGAQSAVWSPPSRLLP